MMRRLLQFSLILLPLLTAQANPADWDRLYQEAQEAYDRGDFPQAAQRYRTLQEEGQDAPEVLFNHGNARYRMGEVGAAIALYRQAQYRSPRDPDIQANLRVAQQQVGALATDPTMQDIVLGHFSRREWRWIAGGCYWLAAALGAMYLLAFRLPWIKRCAILAAAGLAFAAAGGWYWHQYRHQPEVVVTRPGVQALFAPMKGALVHFALPEGSRARMREQSDRWIKIAVGRQEGWIPRDTCDPLSLP